MFVFSDGIITFRSTGWVSISPSWSIATEMGYVNAKILKKKKSNLVCKKKMLSTWGCFWLIRKTVNAQNEWWKHSCRICYDVVNFSLMWRLFMLMASLRFHHNDNMAGSNISNRFVLTNEETEILLALIHEKICLYQHLPIRLAQFIHSCHLVWIGFSSFL